MAQSRYSPIVRYYYFKQPSMFLMFNGAYVIRTHIQNIELGIKTSKNFCCVFLGILLLPFLLGCWSLMPTPTLQGAEAFQYPILSVSTVSWLSKPPLESMTRDQIMATSKPCDFWTISYSLCIWVSCCKMRTRIVPTSEVMIKLNEIILIHVKWLEWILHARSSVQ